MIGVFDRSHYEDVLIARVRELAPRRGDRAPLRRDQRLREAAGRRGHGVVKCMLHISPEEQKARLLARLDDPTKLLEVQPGDIDERQRWADYQGAYEIALERTNTEHAPWLRRARRPQVVPQARRRQVLLRDAAARWTRAGPAADFDVEEQRGGRSRRR